MLKKGYVYNQYDEPIYFEAIIHFMDDDLREKLHREIAPCTEQEFFDRYADLHYEVFGEEWVCNRMRAEW